MNGWAGPGRRGVLALGAATVLAACTPTAKGADGDKVRTDLKPLERRFTALGPMSDAHWLGTALGTDSRVPGPTDVRVVGTAQLKAGAVAAILRTRDFQHEPPSGIPAQLTKYLPKNAKWVHSPAFDDELTGGTYPGTFHLDPDTDRVYFDTTNPTTPTH
ncbi:hypothetical protein F7R91_03205 [Streptomyces luteolifulvus]|uniref:Uncharacterized protein n=1 Tax=Streptomyces luteolifulvus TaxID=2615112 RepID=A0A6H9V468_9ACTN|nr:hypothetical protein [Streptomyces luteolifulvus]KAB1149863.1 hypothetical protein F7R91_03205 [Streptomyces luteolifulvus]